MSKRGRPTRYRDSIARAICIRLAAGESLKYICELPKYPGKTTVYRWLTEKKDFREMYQHARELQQEHYLDEIIEIADDGSNDYYEKEGKNGSFIAFDNEHVQRSRLRIDTRKWVMERLATRKYGNKSQVDHTSSDGSMSPAFDESKYKSAQDNLKDLD